MIVINQCKLIMCTHKSHRLCKQGIKNLKKNNNNNNQGLAKGVWGSNFKSMTLVITQICHCPGCLEDKTSKC